MSVLIGIGTVGPAEILANAIADNKRGETVGDRTYGTASMQKLIEMDDREALILTVANYYTPDNKEIPANGVAATAEVRPTLDDASPPPASRPPVPSGRLFLRRSGRQKSDRHSSEPRRGAKGGVVRREFAARAEVFSVPLASRLRRFFLSPRFFFPAAPKKFQNRAPRDYGEVVSAAQKITGRKSEITIRPELQPSKSGAGKLAADEIYISLPDDSETSALRRSGHRPPPQSFHGANEFRRSCAL